MSVAQAQREISAVEFAEWKAYDNIALFSFETSHHLMATLCAILANAHSKKGGFKPDDFLPKTRKPRDSAKDIETKLRAMFPK